MDTCIRFLVFGYMYPFFRVGASICRGGGRDLRWGWRGVRVPSSGRRERVLVAEPVASQVWGSWRRGAPQGAGCTTAPPLPPLALPVFLLAPETIPSPFGPLPPHGGFVFEAYETTRFHTYETTAVS